MGHKIVYTADVHGNTPQYRALADYTAAVGADSLIIGGDLVPKGIAHDAYIQTQLDYARTAFPDEMQRLKDASPDTGIYLITGNDDVQLIVDELEARDDLWQLVNNRRVRLDDTHDIVGYPYVPITPFGIKDWEKFEYPDMPQRWHEEYVDRWQRTYAFEGHKSSPEGWVPFQFTRGMVDDSISRDLADPRFTESPETTVYVMHSPPHGTALDMMAPVGTQSPHVGSFAIRDFIDNHQPLLTLHGHIHETVDISGRFSDKLGRTYCLAPGNRPEDDVLAVIDLDLDNPSAAKRILLRTDGPS